MYVSDIISLNDREFDAFAKWLETSFEQIIFDDNVKRRIKIIRMFRRLLGLRRFQVATKRSEKRKHEDELDANADKKAKLDIYKQVTLPNEIWLKIMSQMETKDLFGNFALVCKQFNKLSKDYNSIKTFHVKNIREPKQFKSLIKVINRLKNLHEIKIENDIPYSSDDTNDGKTYIKHIMQHALKSCPKLKSLKIDSGSTLSDKCEDFLIKHGKNLECLEMNGIHFKDHRTSPIAELSNLKSLLISHGFGKSGHEDLKLIADCCKSLEKIDFSGLKVIWSDYGQDVGLHYFLKTLKNTLRSFTISGRVQEYGYDKENSLLQNLASCEKIEEVKLLNAKFVTNNDLNAISLMSKLQKLEFVKLGRLDMGQLSKHGYKEILEKNKLLDLSTFFKKLNTDSLQYLSISQCEVITEDNVKTLFTNGCPELKKLVFEKCPNLTLKENTLKILVKNCPKIQTLKFHWRIIANIPVKHWRELSKSIFIFISMGKNCLSIDDFVNNKKGIFGK